MWKDLDESSNDLMIVLIAVVIIFLVLHRISVKSRNFVERLSNPGLRRVQRSDVVFSLTTIPSRIAQIRGCLESLINQTIPLHINIHIPEFSNPEPGRVYLFPEDILTHPWISIIQTTEDLGSATRVISEIFSTVPLQGQRSVIIVDDDVEYPRNLAEKLIRAANTNPRAVYGFRGAVFDGVVSKTYLKTINSTDVLANRRVAMLHGSAGYIIPSFVINKLRNSAKLDPKHISELADVLTRVGDEISGDVWLGGQLSREKIPKFVLPGSSVSDVFGCFVSLKDMLGNTSENPSKVASRLHSLQRGISLFWADWRPEEIEKPRRM